MYLGKISVAIQEHNAERDYPDLLLGLLGCLQMNGQVLGRKYPISKDKNILSIYVGIPDTDSLCEKYNNKHVDDAILSLGGREAVTCIFVGEDHKLSNVCRCEKREFLILFTTFIAAESPLTCGNCFGDIPLYKIPSIYNGEYYDIIKWEDNYQACDQLQMSCTVGEKFAVDQMERIDSELNRMGIEVCNKISEICKIPAYYYLYRGSGKSKEKERDRLCSRCGSPWLLADRLNIFDFKCDRCHLLSVVG